MQSVVGEGDRMEAPLSVNPLSEVEDAAGGRRKAAAWLILRTDRRAVLRGQLQSHSGYGATKRARRLHG